MSSDLETLDALLQKPKSEKKILAFFAGMSESQRRGYSKHCATWYRKQLKEQRDNMWNETSSGTSFNFSELLPPAVLAAYCCCSFQVIKTGGWLTRIDIDLVHRALADRRPSWASQWLEHYIRSARSTEWHGLRQLILDGICERPQDEHYIRLMIDGLSVKGRKVAVQLRKDPDLLANEFWQVFQVPGVIRNGGMFGYVDDRWADGIVQLEKNGELDRAKLFESILATPHMGFNRSQIKFFLDLHDRLKPTDDELRHRINDYVGLVDSPLAPVAKWSFERLRSLDDSAPLPLETIGEVLRNSFATAPKGQVKQSLRWLRDIIGRDPVNKAAVIGIAVSGLLHEKADVQAEVWKFLEKHAQGDEPFAERLQVVRPHVSASTRKAIEKWLRDAAVGTPAGKAETPTKRSPASDGLLQPLAAEVEDRPKRWRKLCAVDELLAAAGQNPLLIPPTRFSGMEFQRLPLANPLPAVESLDELFDVAAAALESSERFEEGEQVIDALTRIAVDTEHAAYGPLKKRLNQLTRRFSRLFFIGAMNQVDLVPMLQCWAKTQSVAEIKKEVRKTNSPGPHGLVGVLSIRNRAIFERLAADQPMTLLGTMTHRGGWIDPRRLVERLKAVDDEGGLLEQDLVLSLLRLAPDGRRDALRELNRARKLKSEFAQALRYALGGTVKIGDSAPLWVAAARARSPYEDDLAVEKRFPNLGPDAGRVAKYQFQRNDGDFQVYAEGSPVCDAEYWRYPKKPLFDFPTVIPHQFVSGKSAVDAADTRPEPRECANAAATVWPLNRDGFYANRYIPADDLDPLFDPCTPIHAPQSMAIVQSLISGYVIYAPEVTAAVDLAIATIEDGRYDACQIGEFLAMYIESVQRFVKGLKTIAEVSALHSYQMAQTILAIFDHPLPDKLPARISDLYGLLYELLVELNMPVPQDKRERLAARAQGASKSAKLLKQILEFSPDAPFDAHSIIEPALAGRLSAERALV